MISKFIILLLIQMYSCKVSEEDNSDNVLNLFLNGDIYDVEQSTEEIIDEQPTLIEGLWRCGNCDVIDDSKLIYTEVNEVEANDFGDDTPVSIQVGLAFDNMYCITVSSDTDQIVRTVSGDCAGAAVTLAVHSAGRFVVNIYGK